MDSAATISVCVLVKNEARLLARLLASVAGVADEIVVVDNGSSDDTARVAREYTDKLLYKPDEALDRARNYYLEAASSDWILVLDADELVINRQLTALKRELAATPASVSALLLPGYQYIGHGRWSHIDMLRVIRNDPRIRYTVNGIHDTMAYSAAVVGRIANTQSCAIHHYDILLPGRALLKRQRNISAIRHALRAADLDSRDVVRMFRFLAAEYIAIGRLEAAERLLRGAMSRHPESEDSSRIYLSQLYRSMGRYDDALRVLDDLSNETYGPLSQARIIRAEIALRTGNQDSAIAIIQEALTDDQTAAHLHANIAALVENDNPALAVHHLRRAAIQNPLLREPGIYSEGHKPNFYTFQDALLSVYRNYYSHLIRALGRLGDVDGARDVAIEAAAHGLCDLV